MFLFGMLGGISTIINYFTLPEVSNPTYTISERCIDLGIRSEVGLITKSTKCSWLEFHLAR